MYHTAQGVKRGDCARENSVFPTQFFCKLKLLLKSLLIFKREKNTTFQKLCDAYGAVLRQKSLSLHAYIEKESLKIS